MLIPTAIPNCSTPPSQRVYVDEISAVEVTRPSGMTAAMGDILGEETTCATGDGGKSPKGLRKIDSCGNFESVRRTKGKARVLLAGVNFA